MKRLLLLGTAVMSIIGDSGEAQTKVSPHKAAQEVITTCKEKNDNINSDNFMLCVVSQPYLHNSCHQSSSESPQKNDWLEELKKCQKPIQDAAINLMLKLRFEENVHFPANNISPKHNIEMENLFFNDRAIIGFRNKHAKPDLPEMPVSQDNAEHLRREWCSGGFVEVGMPTQRVFDACNRLFKKPTYALAFSNVAENQKSKDSSPSQKNDPHQKCLEAKDYEGCIKVMTSKATTTRQDKCTKDGLCKVTTKGPDSYGLPKPMGWLYTKADDGRIFYFYGPLRIPHKGQETRYIAFKRMTRYYQNPRAGSSGTFIGGTTGYTNCTGYGSSVNCTTTGTSPTYIPGSSARPGGVISSSFVNVFDCKDNTYASYKNGQIWTGWKDVKKKKPPAHQRLLQDYCKEGDKYIMNNMDVLELDM